jgi:hypothetical protein
MQELSQSGRQRHGGVSAGLLAPGVILAAGTAVLAARLTWEMTLLTWQEGPQMVGFSLAHGYGAILFFFPIALSVWLLVFLVVCVVRKAKRRTIGRLGWSVLAVAALTLGELSLPQGFWDGIFASKLAASPKSSEFLVQAAGKGELHTLKALIARGTPIQSTNYEGSTALHYAACAGEPAVVRYLIAAGANVNALNMYGDSPLVCPEEKHNEAIVTMLEAAGGREIRGSEEQHQRASKAIMDREIEEQRKRFKEYAK